VLFRESGCTDTTTTYGLVAGFWMSMYSLGYVINTDIDLKLELLCMGLISIFLYLVGTSCFYHV